MDSWRKSQALGDNVLEGTNKLQPSLDIFRILSTKDSEIQKNRTEGREKIKRSIKYLILNEV